MRISRSLCFLTAMLAFSAASFQSYAADSPGISAAKTTEGIAADPQLAAYVVENLSGTADMRLASAAPEPHFLDGAKGNFIDRNDSPSSLAGVIFAWLVVVAMAGALLWLVFEASRGPGSRRQDLHESDGNDAAAHRRRMLGDEPIYAKDKRAEIRFGT